MNATVRTEAKKIVSIQLRGLFKAVGVDPDQYRIESHSIYGNPNMARNDARAGYLELVLRESYPDETRK